MASFKAKVRNKSGKTLHLNRIGGTGGASIQVSGVTGPMPSVGDSVDIMISGSTATITHDGGKAKGTVNQN